ncbi:Acyl-homoserine-lactone synthase LuxI [hydrothermal vent metagenome]|uniref:acyl-homoserine-lactone synthase n=1 Tax=hydrothermal vent metagenome TaxID=652676 RepID=A0A3B0Y4D4_9ZZZZ
MCKIVLGGGDAPRFGQSILLDMFAFRHKVFYRQLGWEVQTRYQLEFDDFDDMDPVYMVAEDDGGGIEGCWRLLPTTGPYMLRDTFPQLLKGELAPQDSHVWELSRFAVAAHEDARAQQAPLNDVTLDMIREVYDFAVAHDIHEYVTVTSVALERLLKRTGLPIRRFGDGKAQRVGKVLTVACHVDINDQFRDVVYSGSRSFTRAA